MKKFAKPICTWLLLLAIAMTMLLTPTEAKAEILKGRYNTLDAQAFYNTLVKNDKDAVFDNNNIYFATCAWMASTYSSRMARSAYPTWGSIGWTLRCSNSAGSIEIEIANPYTYDGGGKYLNRIPEASRIDGRYGYELYALCYDDIVDLCTAKDAAKANAIFSQSN